MSASLVNYLLYGIYDKTMLKVQLFEKCVQFTKAYGGKNFISSQAGNDFIRLNIASDEPFLVARFGSTELAIMRQAEEIKLGIRSHFNENLAKQAMMCSGFFPSTQENLLRFAHIMTNITGQVDLVGIWYNPMENYFLKTYNNHTITTPLTALEPWYHNNPWSVELQGKSVLVIHPFAETILKQYKKRNLIYPSGLLPDCNLIVHKAVQTIAGQRDDRFNNWFEALEYMYNQAMKENFDVAILGCGAYGLPLAAKLKEQEKKVIHLGGATQLLFGIKGRRWDNRPEISKFYNESWVRPSEKESVVGQDAVEQGCYW